MCSLCFFYKACTHVSRFFFLKLTRFKIWTSWFFTGDSLNNNYAWMVPLHSYMNLIFYDQVLVFFFWKREIHSFIIRRVHYEHLIGENNGQSIMLESTMSPRHTFWTEEALVRVYLVVRDIEIPFAICIREVSCTPILVLY